MLVTRHVGRCCIGNICGRSWGEIFLADLAGAPAFSLARPPRPASSSASVLLLLLVVSQTKRLASMAPTGLYDDPVVIDDKVDDTAIVRPQSFHQMKAKLDTLKREIEEVIEMEEKKLRQQEERELSQFCEDHHIIMLDQEVEYDSVNAMMVMRLIIGMEY